MIPSNQLRAGNYVHSNFGQGTVSCIDTRTLHLITVSGISYKESMIQEHIYPIQLNDKILSECRNIIDGTAINICWTIVKVGGDSYRLNFEGRNAQMPTFKYVHELQNIFFIITGEELQLVL